MKGRVNVMLVRIEAVLGQARGPKAGRDSLLCSALPSSLSSRNPAASPLKVQLSIGVNATDLVNARLIHSQTFLLDQKEVGGGSARPVERD
jgi:hypothetical protein